MELPTPQASLDSRLPTSDGSYILPKPVRSTKPARSRATSEDLATPAGSQSSNFFTNPDTDENNPLYAPDSHLTRVRQLADDVQHWQEGNHNLMGAITFTFNLDALD